MNVDKPVCKYGKKCYRKNPIHFEEFSHPEGSEVLREEVPMAKRPRMMCPREGIITLDDDDDEYDSDSEPAVVVKEKKKADTPLKSLISVAGGSEDWCKSSTPFFYLTKVQGLSSRYNGCDMALGIKDILSMGDLVASVQFNYLFDIEWMVRQYPEGKRNTPILVVVGDKRDAIAQMNIKAFPNIKLLAAKLDSPFGCHHSKMMLLQYDQGLCVVIHTANLIRQDWHQKTQGVWMSPVFPRMQQSSSSAQAKLTANFKDDLIAYLEAYGSSALKDWIELIKQHDTSAARVRLIGSVPGAHTGTNMHRWGHLKLKKLLREQEASLEEVTEEWPVVGQFSSVGSLGPNSQSWLCSEWLLSLSSCKTKTASSFHKYPPLKLIFPSVDNVRNSLEGYMAGGSLPYATKTALKQPYLTSYFHLWKADGTGRSAASPHIKTYCRFSKDFSKAAWFLLTSANLSKAAWGGFEKKGSQLRIRSYEVGVVFLPSYQDPPMEYFEVIKSLVSQQRDTCHGLQVPYDVPLTAYSGDDEPWIWDKQHCQPDLLGNVWNPS